MEEKFPLIRRSTCYFVCDQRPYPGGTWIRIRDERNVELRLSISPSTL